MLIREILLDRQAFDRGEIRLSEAPAGDPKTLDAAGFAFAYGGMVSYESALDAAGYATEEEMDEPEAKVLVMQAEIHDDGRIVVLSRGDEFSAEAKDIYAAHEMQLRAEEPALEPGG